MRHGELRPYEDCTAGKPVRIIRSWSELVRVAGWLERCHIMMIRSHMSELGVTVGASLLR